MWLSAVTVPLGSVAALLDQLSGGRRGGRWVDLEVFGSGLDRYEHGFAEGLDLLLDWLTLDRIRGTARFPFREVPVVPAPLTRPHPPVVVACTSRATMELAARRGLPMLLGMHIGDAEKADMVACYEKAAAGAGHDPRAVKHIAAGVALLAEDARRQLRAALPEWLRAGLAAHIPVDDRARPDVGGPGTVDIVSRRPTEPQGYRDGTQPQSTGYPH